MMAKLPRIKQEIFGSEAGPQDIGVVGSLHEGNPTYATTTEQIQSLDAFKRGLRSVVIGENSPILEEDNGMYKLITHQLAYILQSGIPEWDTNTTYFYGNIVRGSNSEIYICVSFDQDGTNQPVSSTDDWEHFPFRPSQWVDNFIEYKKVKSSLIAESGIIFHSLNTPSSGSVTIDLEASLIQKEFYQEEKRPRIYKLWTNSPTSLDSSGIFSTGAESLVIELLRNGTVINKINTISSQIVVGNSRISIPVTSIEFMDKDILASGFYAYKIRAICLFTGSERYFAIDGCNATLSYAP